MRSILLEKTTQKTSLMLKMNFLKHEIIDQVKFDTNATRLKIYLMVSNCLLTKKEM